MDPQEVKPKEDQIKCALYAALKNSGAVVHVEATYNGEHKQVCDLRAKFGETYHWIEIKTAWAAPGWVNKLNEQVGTWCKDIERLRGVEPGPNAAEAYFVLFVFYGRDSPAAKAMLSVVEELDGTLECLFRGDVSVGFDWHNGLNAFQYSLWRVGADCSVELPKVCA